MKMQFGCRSGVDIDEEHMSEEMFNSSSESWLVGERVHQWESIFDQFGDQIPIGVELRIWIEQLMEAMGSSMYRFALIGGTRRHPGLRICFATTDTYLLLEYEASKRRYRACVRGDQHAKQRESALKWKNAISLSLRVIAESRGQVEWAAAVGPFEPYNMTPEVIGKLSSSGLIGNLSLTATPIHQQEWFPSKVLHSSSGATTWLIKVTGSSSSPVLVEKQASEELRRLCLVLSIATRRSWAVRTSIETESADLIPTITSEKDSELFQEEFRIEQWMTAAYGLLERDEVYLDAARVFHEGVGLVGEHPSLAQVALIASIETLAEREFGRLQSCSLCGGVTGIGGRFKQMLLTVLEPEKVRRLTSAYDSRSRTVHAGALHGHEAAVSLAGEVHSPFDTGAKFQFDVWDLCVAASKLLQRAVTQTDHPSESQSQVVRS